MHSRQLGFSIARLLVFALMIVFTGVATLQPTASVAASGDSAAGAAISIHQSLKAMPKTLSIICDNPFHREARVDEGAIQFVLDKKAGCARAENVPEGAARALAERDGYRIFGEGKADHTDATAEEVPASEETDEPSEEQGATSPLWQTHLVDQPVTNVKGIGPKTSEMLSEVDVATVSDLARLTGLAVVGKMTGLSEGELHEWRGKARAIVSTAAAQEASTEATPGE